MTHRPCPFVCFNIVLLFFISIRIVLLPSPGVFAHLFDAVLSLPAKFLLCQRSIGIAGGDIACTAGFDHVRNLHSGSCFEVLHDVQNTVAHTSSQIVDLQSCILLNLLQSLYVALCQINDMDVVTYTGSVGGIVIITEDTQLFQLADCYL